MFSGGGWFVSTYVVRSLFAAGYAFDFSFLDLLQTQYFLITETYMVIQTEVTLQPGYVLSACEGDTSQSIAEIVILSPAQRTPMVKSSTIILVVLIFLSAMWRH